MAASIKIHYYYFFKNEFILYFKTVTALKINESLVVPVNKCIRRIV